MLGLAAAVLVYAVYKALRDREPRAASSDDSGPRIVFDEVVEPSELRRQLQRYRSERDWRQAVVAAFRLSVLGLIDARVAREVAGATTGDFANAVEARKPELLATYRPAAAAFERAFYSDLEIDESDLDAVDTLLARLQTVGAE